MMHTTCFNSSLSLRCSYFDYPTYLLDARFEINPSFTSSSFASCCCCCCCCAANENPIYNRLARINPIFLSNGLRPSTLIEFSPSKRSIVHDTIRRRQSCISNSRLSSLTDSDPSYCYKKLYSFKERRKLGKGRYACWSYEDKKKQQLFTNETDVDEVEILLDLLIEEVGLDNIGVKARKRIQKKDPSNFTCKIKTVDSGSVKQDLKCDNKAAELQSSEEEFRRLRSNEKTTLVNRQGKKEGSSCSSYYSVSSTGEYDSDNDVEFKHDDCFVRGESSKDDGKMDFHSRIYDEEEGEEESEMLKNNSAETCYGNQEWRKKSEKKLQVDSSQHQSQISLNTMQDSHHHHNKKAERINDQSQTRIKYKRRTKMSDTDNRMVIESSSSTRKQYSDTENKFSTSVQELASEHKGESCDSVAQQAEYRKQSNVTIEASGIHEINRKVASSSSSSLETRMKN